MRTIRSILAVCCLSFWACDNGGSKPALSHNDAGNEPIDTPDSDRAPDPDASTSSNPIPLAVWVEGLVEQRSAEDAVPDTVHDKNIEDTDDPSAFDKYLQ